MFLATTALEEFWNTDDQICFLGEWCKLYDRKDFWQKLDYIDNTYIWNNIERKEAAYYYCWKVYQLVIKGLKEKLNNIHNLNKDTKYYESIMGAWLIRYIFQMYDKYLTLQSFIETHKYFETYFLDETQFYIPLDYQDSMMILDEDIFHLQQYTKILKTLGYNFQTKYSKNPLIQKNSYIRNNNIVSFFKRLFFNFQYKINKFISDQHIMMVNPYIKNVIKTSLFLFFKSDFKITLNDFKYKINFNFEINYSLRNQYLDIKYNNKFEEIISKNIFSDLPIIFIEGFQNFRNQVLKQTKNIKVDLIYTTNSLYGNEVFKFFLAEYNLYDKLLAHQHGNSYGVDRFIMGEDYESSLAKYYYTWGWRKTKKFRFLPSGKLENSLKKEQSDYILYIMTALPRYLYVMKPYIISSDFLFSYIKNSIEFLTLYYKNMENDKMIIREYFYDYKWNIKKRILDSVNNKENIIFNNIDNIYKQISYAKICIFDHFQTTALETLAMNKATIIFIDKKIYGYRKEAQPFFDKLEKVKILHYTPISAYKHYRNIKENIDLWWNSEKVQKVREEFCYHYARTSENWIDEWIKEFNEVLNE